jgi:polysaccharide export outer membrane protein
VTLPDHDFTVLDLIAESGGVPADMVNPQVQVARGGKLYGTGFDNLVENPSLDAVLRPGDRIYLQPEDRYFMSFGAASKETQIDFPRAEVSALDAVTLIGGLNDTIADPKGVLILRNYPASAVRADGKGPSKDRMIFVFDLMSADGLFSARQFQIQNQDLVMVAQAPLVNQMAIADYLSTLFAVPARATGAIAFVEAIN